jgi:hypothetical protein
MQNEPNLEIDPMTVTKVLTTDYDRRTLGARGKNKPNSNPIQTQFKANQSQFALSSTNKVGAEAL